jgi:membrane fusion protein, macrolide-specific efflux system
MKAGTVRLFSIAAIAMGAFAVWALPGQRNPAAAQASADYEFISLAKGHIEATVTAQGKLEPREYVVVGAQVSGQLKKIHVEIGDTVKAGALLAEIDPRVYQARVQADLARLKNLQAQLNEQSAQIALAEQSLARQQHLIETHAVSQEALQISETALKVGQAKAESIKAQIEEAQSTLEGDKTNLGYTRIYAPINGTVVSLSAREGQTLNANQQAPSILQISNLDSMTVRAQVAEADVMRLVPGLPAYFTTLGAQERRWRGTVRQILPSPEIVNDVVLFHALVDVDNHDRQLMSSMSTQLFFVLGEADQVPLLPLAALGKRRPAEDDKTGQAYQIRVKQGDGLAEKTIHVGLMNRTQAQVNAGLSESEQVAVPIRKQAAAKPQSRQGPAPVGPRL